MVFIIYALMNFHWCSRLIILKMLQAQKLISLCGWEPRSLPYIVDSKDGQNQFVKDADILNSSEGVGYGRNVSLSLHATDENENSETNKDLENSFGLQYDPKSVVLDCRFCGASVGLWAFATVQRPVEFFRLVGCAEVNPGVHDSGHESNVGDGIVAIPSNIGSSSMGQSSNLKLTIAGGPPPARQNFKATISLPVIGQSLRARLSYHPEFRDQIHNNLENTQAESNCNRIQGEIDCFNNSVNGEVVVLKDVRTLNSKRILIHCMLESFLLRPKMLMFPLEVQELRIMIHQLWLHLKRAIQSKL